MQLKIVRLSKKARLKYKRSISALRYHGPVVTNSKPYIGMLDKNTNKIISCIWIDEMNEISIVTHESYRRANIMTQLLTFIKQDVYVNKLDEINASPINPISKRLLKKNGFKRSWMPGYYEYSIN